MIRNITLVAGIVALSLIGVAGVIGVTATLEDSSQRGIVMATMTGFLAPTILALLSLLRGEQMAKISKGQLETSCNNIVERIETLLLRLEKNGLAKNSDKSEEGVS